MRSLVLLFALCLGLAGCSNAPTIFVQANLDPALPAADQLSFRVEKSGAATLGPSLRPEAPSSTPLELEQSVRLVLPDTYAGTVTVQVEALSGGAVVGAGSAEGLARPGNETTVVVSVALPLGQCDAANCPNGCCANGVCVVNGINLCGTGAGTCSACDPLVADRCDNGVCRCGSGPECQNGQTCTNGACRCDSTTCANGCCSGNNCLAGNTDSQCGTAGTSCSACTPTAGCSGGVCPDCAAACDGGCCSGNTCNAPGLATCGTAGGACVVCDPARSDRCTAGACACGAGPPCSAGQACVGGACVCNSTSCPRGCCSGNQCQQPSLTACGTDGGTCSACDPAIADRCTATGQCACGTAAACQSPGACIGGQCLCDGGACGPPCNASTCPNGCCSGGVCLASAMANCGVGGAACADCRGVANSCNNGVCRCKNSPGCQEGQRCVTTGSGSCVCDTNSNCQGCCSGNTCIKNTSFMQCGTAGASCFGCNLSNSDQCLNGACRCGTTGNTCGGALSCDAGMCI